MDASNGSTVGAPSPKFNGLQQLLSAKNGGTIFDLAFYCGVKPQIARQWLEGERTPSHTKIRKIAKYLCVPVVDVVNALPGIQATFAHRPIHDQIRDLCHRINARSCDIEILLTAIMDKIDEMRVDPAVPSIGTFVTCTGHCNSLILAASNEILGLISQKGGV